MHKLHDELSEVMVKNVTVRRNNKDLQFTIDKIKELKERCSQITLDDRGTSLNQTYAFASQFGAMLEIALTITKGALLRDEFRGAHYKPQFPRRDDENWLKTTKAMYREGQEPEIVYEKVDLRHLDPVERDYSHAKKVKPQLKNVPKNIDLPILSWRS